VTAPRPKKNPSKTSVDQASPESTFDDNFESQEDGGLEEAQNNADAFIKGLVDRS